MKIFLAGGTGVIGSRLIPRLLEAGHEVSATTRHESSLLALENLGAHPVRVDVFDAQGLSSVLAEAAPELVIHELTDLSDYDTAANARLRREGTANLVAAAESAGVERMIVQSIAWAYAESYSGTGSEDGRRPPAVEPDPLEPGSAVEEMESLVARLPRATILRYGMLYGPGTWYAPGGRVADAVSAGQVPATSAITSFAHIDDVIAATVQAIDWPDGIYNIVDDEPAPDSDWLPVYAKGIGAPEPQAVELPAGTPTGRGASNSKAHRMGWTPMYPSWREGFPHRR